MCACQFLPGLIYSPQVEVRLWKEITILPPRTIESGAEFSVFTWCPAKYLEQNILIRNMHWNTGPKLYEEGSVYLYLNMIGEVAVQDFTIFDFQIVIFLPLLSSAAFVIKNTRSVK